MTDDSDSTLRPGKPAWAAELSEREWFFCEQFAVDLNATEAAVRAGYGKTRKRAKEAASKMRRNPRIAAAISRLVAERAGVTQTTLLAELGAIAKSRVTDVFGPQRRRLDREGPLGITRRAVGRNRGHRRGARPAMVPITRSNARGPRPDSTRRRSRNRRAQAKICFEGILTDTLDPTRRTFGIPACHRPARSRTFRTSNHRHDRSW
jgi:Terminase small subunit